MKTIFACLFLFFTSQIFSEEKQVFQPLSIGLDFGELIIDQNQKLAALRLSTDFYLGKQINFSFEILGLIPYTPLVDSLVNFQIGISWFLLSTNLTVTNEENFGVYLKALVVQDMWLQSANFATSLPAYNIGLSIALGYKFYITGAEFLYFAPELGYTGRFLGWGSVARVGFFVGANF